MQTFTRREMLKAGTGLFVLPGLMTQSRAFAQKTITPPKRLPYEDAILVDGPPPLPQPGSFTIAVLPDTQNYSQKFPETFLAQTRWIAEQKAARNISCVLHLGDVTNTSAPAEWEVAQRSMRQLDSIVPYFMVPGNHDYGEGGKTQNRETLFSEYFPVSHYRGQPTFGGTYDRESDRLENAYYRFTANGRKFLVLALEFGPRKDVVRWANGVVEKHRNHEVILITHAYMYYDDTRYDVKTYGTNQKWNPHHYPVAKVTNDDVTDGTELWNDLVSRHENFVLTLNGHVLGDGLGRLTSQTPAGRDVHQHLVNFQMRPKGGDGWLRLIEFKADGTSAQTYDYSPSLNKRNESPQNQFAFQLSPIQA